MVSIQKITLNKIIWYWKVRTSDTLVFLLIKSALIIKIIKLTNMRSDDFN